MHEFLCDLPLKSGKLVYVDKTFAPDKATAERIFAIADAHGTKCYSSSALRFATELGEIDKSKIFKIYSEGQILSFSFLSESFRISNLRTDDHLIRYTKDLAVLILL
jgi:hypothetical protein